MQVHPDVAEALGRLRDLAGLRQPDDPLLADFLPLYYSELPEGDVDDRKLDDIYAVAVAHLAVGRRRAPGETIVRLISPDRERDGWHSPHSVLLVVTDDMPFLVDTMRMVLERHGLEIHLLVHPMLTVERRDDNTLVVVDADDGLVEAWTQIEIDRIDGATARTVQEEVVRAIEDVRLVVEDFPAMRARMEELGRDRPAPAVARRGPVRVPRRRRLRPGGRRHVDPAKGERARSGPTARSDRPPAGARRPARRHRPQRRHRHRVPGRAPYRGHRPTRRCDRAAIRRLAGDERLPGQRARHPSHRRRRPPRPRPHRGAHALPLRPGHPDGAGEPAARSGPRARTRPAPTARQRHRRAAGAPAGPRVRGARPGRPVDHCARLPPAQPVHGRAPRTGRRRRRRRLRRGPISARSSRWSERARSPASRSACAGPARRAGSTSTFSNGPSTSCRRRGPSACGPLWSASSARRRASTSSIAWAVTPPPRTAPRWLRNGRPATSAASPPCSTAPTSSRLRSATTSTPRRASGGSACTARDRPWRSPSCSRSSTTSASRHSTSSRTRSGPATRRCSSTTSA